MYLLRLAVSLVIFGVLITACQNKIHHSLSNKSELRYNNYLNYNNYVIANRKDSIYLEVLQGVGSGNLKYISFTYRSTIDSFLFVLERAGNNLIFKPIYMYSNFDKLANIPLTITVTDSNAHMDPFNFYRLKTYDIRKGKKFPLKNYNILPIIKVQTNNMLVRYSLAD